MSHAPSRFRTGADSPGAPAGRGRVRRGIRRSGAPHAGLQIGVRTDSWAIPCLEGESAFGSCADLGAPPRSPRWARGAPVPLARGPVAVDTAGRIGDALPAMLSVGVQTWGTDVTALKRYWKAADDLGYARITYGDGLADSTHDGLTMPGAITVLTRRARIPPGVTCACSHPETTASPPPTASGIGVETPHQEPPRG